VLRQFEDQGMTPKTLWQRLDREKKGQGDTRQLKVPHGLQARPQEGRYVSTWLSKEELGEGIERWLRLKVRPNELDILFKRMGGGDEGYDTKGPNSAPDRADDALPQREGIVSFAAFSKAVPKLRRHRHRMVLEKHALNSAHERHQERHQGARARLYMQGREDEDGMWLQHLLGLAPAPKPRWSS
jgi:hypothetical protein